METAKRAIIMAAGNGSRMHPVTKTIPKPLIPVNGVPMIETIINALESNGIYDINIVIGHLKEKFYSWAEKYPHVNLIENPYYQECNNISSLYMARNLIPESFILDGDQIIHNKAILSPVFEKSGYCCTWQDSYTNEWLLQEENGTVTHCSRTGGQKGWQLYSLSMWGKKDGLHLGAHIEKEFIKNKNKQIYWDDVALFCYPEQYKLGIRKINNGDILELDTLAELIEQDASYSPFNLP